MTKKSDALALRPAVSASQATIWHWLSCSWCKKSLFLICDLIAVMAAHWLAEVSVHHFLQIPEGSLAPSGYYLFYVPFFAALLYLLEGYKSPDLRRPEKELQLVFTGVSLSFAALVCANFVLFKTLGFSRYLVLAWYALTLFLMLGIRFSLRTLYDSLWRRGLAQQKALLVGSTITLAEYQTRLSIQRYEGYRIAGVLAEPDSRGALENRALGLPVLGSLDQWEHVAEKHKVQLIFLRLPTTSCDSHPRVLEIIRRCQEKRIDVEVYSDLFGSPEFNYERDEFSGFFRFYATPRWSRALERLVKSALDKLIGLVGSLVTLLLVPVVGLLIKLEDSGPIFYPREFVGCDGKVHYYFKFRTMREDADQILQNTPALREKFAEKFKLANDPRVLRVGRFLRKYSIDEFPQFFGLLSGQLTFVGPRVISWDERDRYGEQLKMLLSVKPGLTGFWQVMGRQTTTYEERVRMDMFYIEHWSIWLDLVIMAKTAWKVLRAEGAH
ncbi:MAG: sugar transferase [Acidobacteria bacterium]|nr:sugar transferase [Acidobacteriota bacterium]